MNPTEKTVAFFFIPLQLLQDRGERDKDWKWSFMLIQHKRTVLVHLGLVILAW